MRNTPDFEGHAAFSGGTCRLIYDSLMRLYRSDREGFGLGSEDERMDALTYFLAALEFQEVRGV